LFFFFFNDTATTEIYTLSLHDALPISASPTSRRRSGAVPAKGILAGGALLAVAAIALSMLFLGGHDSGTVVEAKGLLSPDEVVSSSGDLSSTIKAMNQKEHAAVKELGEMAASPSPPAPEAVTQKVNDVSAQAWKAAETATKLSQTAQAQDSGSESAGQMASQYDALAQSLYSQILDLQSLNRQYREGLIDLQRLSFALADYGARFWNPGFIIDGISGNPFVPFLGTDLLGLGPIETPVFLTPDSFTRFASPFGGLEPTIWISTSGDVITRTVTIRLGAVPAAFDPVDLAASLFGGDVLPDPDVLNRIVLAHLGLEIGRAHV